VGCCRRYFHDDDRAIITVQYLQIDAVEESKLGRSRAAALDQAMAVEHRVDGAFGGNPDISVE